MTDWTISGRDGPKWEKVRRNCKRFGDLLNENPPDGIYRPPFGLPAFRVEPQEDSLHQTSIVVTCRIIDGKQVGWFGYWFDPAVFDFDDPDDRRPTALRQLIYDAIEQAIAGHRQERNGNGEEQKDLEIAGSIQ